MKADLKIYTKIIGKKKKTLNLYFQKQSKMNIHKFFTIILSLAIFHSFVYGQGNESVSISSAVDSLPKKHDCKAVEIVGIALPAAMITYGLISLGNNDIRQIDYNVYNSIQKNNRFWKSHAEDYIQFAPAVATYALKFCKVESKDNLLDMTILYGLSNLLAGGITQGGKIVVGRLRPGSETDHSSFPSGHTETAFVAAEFLHQEYKAQSVWISVGGYATATLVGVSRVYHNKHWVSDVVTGAGIGILSTKAVYWVYPYLKKKFGKKDRFLQTFILPGYSEGNLSLTLSKTF